MLQSSSSCPNRSQILMKYRDALVMLQHYSEIANEALKELQSLSPNDAELAVSGNRPCQKNSNLSAISSEISLPESIVQVQRVNASSISFMIPPCCQITFNGCPLTPPDAQPAISPTRAVAIPQHSGCPKIKRQNPPARKFF